MLTYRKEITPFMQRKKGLIQLYQTFAFLMEVTAGFEPADNGVADRGLTTWLRHQILFFIGADYG